MPTIERRVIAIDRTVQGVGFRPFVHRLPAELELRGFVRNDVAGVLIDVEGGRAANGGTSPAVQPPAPAAS